MPHVIEMLERMKKGVANQFIVRTNYITIGLDFYSWIAIWIGQFMRRQPLSRCLLPSPEHHIMSHSKGPRIHHLHRLNRPDIGMHQHLAEVVTEARLEKSAVVFQKRLAFSFEGLNIRFVVSTSNLLVIP